METKETEEEVEIEKMEDEKKKKEEEKESETESENPRPVKRSKMGIQLNDEKPAKMSGRRQGGGTCSFRDGRG